MRVDCFFCVPCSFLQVDSLVDCLFYSVVADLDESLETIVATVVMIVVYN